MSENENQPSAPSKQTSSVPLKKETVRVTLKAADAPAVPSSAVPMAPPVRPPVPTAPPIAGGAPVVGGAPRPPAPAPTIPLRSAGAPTVGGAPAAAPAPTVRLAPSGPATGPKLPGAGAPSTLPKATVQLQPPGPMGTSMSSPGTMVGAQDDDDDDERGEGIANILSIVGFVAALIVLALQLMTANTWISAEGPQTGQWSQLMD